MNKLKLVILMICFSCSENSSIGTPEAPYVEKDLDQIFDLAIKDAGITFDLNKHDGIDQARADLAEAKDFATFQKDMKTSTDISDLSGTVSTINSTKRESCDTVCMKSGKVCKTVDHSLYGKIAGLTLYEGGIQVTLPVCEDEPKRDVTDDNQAVKRFQSMGCYCT